MAKHFGTKGIQVRLDPSDPRLFAIPRDVAHNFQFVVEESDRRLEHKRWPLLHVVTDVPDEDIGKALEAFIMFVVSAVEKPQESMPELIARSGFDKCHPDAQVAVMATIGVIMAGVYFQGVREATLGGVGPCSDVAELVAMGKEVHAWLSMPKWRRWVIKLKRRVVNVLASFRS